MINCTEKQLYRMEMLRMNMHEASCAVVLVNTGCFTVSDVRDVASALDLFVQLNNLSAWI